MQNTEYDPMVEEIDLEKGELYEGKPTVKDSPTKQADKNGNQDDIDEGEALGDDLAKGDTDA